MVVITEDVIFAFRVFSLKRMNPIISDFCTIKNTCAGGTRGERAAADT